MVTTAIPSVQRVLLKNISWQTFETLLEEMGEKRGSRLTYDNGILEIMTPLMPHEYNNRLIHNLIVALAEELNINLKSVGSVTCKRADLSRGVKLDSGFYLQNEPLMRNKQELDLTKDPPPDLVLEVDFTSSSLDRLSIYAALGVPELWRYDQGVLQIYRLQEGVYIPFVVSPAFANLPLTEIPRFLEESLRIGEIPMIRSFRDWVRQQV
ncbi:MAG: Uma2 family endonuclease [Aphanothece sp. CMT-3BRIN-NPC111]|jgi:Uma2 family endonuclease|nr:Uma2 family endonuclease [Aphanothece sp. CMT-3BRIN-NPC111]